MRKERPHVHVLAPVEGTVTTICYERTWDHSLLEFIPIEERRQRTHASNIHSLGIPTLTMMKPDDIQRLASRGSSVASSSNPPDSPSTTASSSEQSQRDCENDTTNTTTNTTTTTAATANNSMGFDTPYKLYCFDDEHLLHRRCDDVNNPSSESTSISQRIASSVQAMLLLDKYRNELCDRRSKHGRNCPYHPAIAETYTKMGLLHQHMLQEPERALRYHSRALELLRKCCDEAASTTTTCSADDANSDKHSKQT